jgi:hypothetical protein
MLRVLHYTLAALLILTAAANLALTASERPNVAQIAALKVL